MKNAIHNIFYRLKIVSCVNKYADTQSHILPNQFKTPSHAWATDLKKKNKTYMNILFFKNLFFLILGKCFYHLTISHSS